MGKDNVNSANVVPIAVVTMHEQTTVVFQIEACNFYKTCFDFLDFHQTPFATAEN